MVAFLLGVFLWLANPGGINAAGSVSLAEITYEITAGDVFDARFQVSGMTEGDIYYYKFYGGISGAENQVKTINEGSELSYTSSWSTFPRLTVGADGQVEVTGKAKLTAGGGSYNLFVRLAKVSATDSQINSSGISINAIAPSPTATAVPQSPSPTPRTLGVKILSLPSSSALGNVFEVKFQINGGNGNYEYFVKGFGGVNDNYSTEIDSNTGWINQDGPWEKMPKFKTNDEGVAEAVVRLRAISNKETGLYRIRVKIKESIGPKEAESELKTIEISKLPSPTPTKKPTPTAEPTDSIYPLPTEPMVDDPTPTSTNIVIENKPETISPVPENKNKLEMSTVLPIGLIGGGGLLLAIPLLISKLKDVKKI